MNSQQVLREMYTETSKENLAVDNFCVFYSIKHKTPEQCGADLPAMGIPAELNGIEPFDIFYTYSVRFIVSQSSK